MKILLTLAFVLLSMANAYSDDTTPPPPLEIESAVKEIVKLTDEGPSPSQIVLHKLDSSVFFVNSTKDSLLTLRVDFGKKMTHCASPNLKMGEDGVIQSVKPIAPKDFALMCFPEKGEYQVQFQGLSKFPKGTVGTVVIE